VHTFSVYGLVIESEIELSPLRPIETQSATDITIVRGRVSENGITDPVFTRVLAQANDQNVWIHVPNIARFLIKNGNHITVDSIELEDIQTICLYLMGSCIGSIIHQRGLLALHASAVNIQGQLVLFMGNSGAGKSTTAAILQQRGFQVVSDDTVVLNDKGQITGGFPQIKLWEHALKNLDIATDGLSRIRHQISKYSFPIDNQSIDLATVKAIYCLNGANQNAEGEFTLHQINGMDKFKLLREHTYRTQIMEGVGAQSKHLKLCANLAESVYMATLVRPTSYFNGNELVDFVLNNLSQNGLYSMPSETL